MVALEVRINNVIKSIHKNYIFYKINLEALEKNRIERFFLIGESVIIIVAKKKNKTIEKREKRIRV